MKLVLKILGILVVIIVMLMIAIPYFYRDKIAQAVKDEINKNVNATVDFNDFSLSLFRSFPDFSLGLEGLSVVNKQPFAGDTLAYIPSFELTLDLMSVIKGEEYILKKITISRPHINLKVNNDGKANWDITPESGEQEKTTPENQSSDDKSFVVRLNHVSIHNGMIVYDDKPLTTTVILDGVEHTLSGDFTADFTTLKTFTKVKSATVIFDKI